MFIEEFVCLQGKDILTIEMTVRALTNFAVPVFSTANWALSCHLQVRKL